MRSPLKDKPFRLPGQGVDEDLNGLVMGRGAKVLVCMALVGGMLLGSAIQLFFGRLLPVALILAALSLVVSLVALAVFSHLARRGAALKLGRDGERYVGQLLQSLNLPGSRVFHDIPADGFNLDHVVICDRGVYVVETKTRSKPPGQTELTTRDGLLLLKGKPVFGNAVGQAAGSARWLRDLIQAEVGGAPHCQAVVVLPGWFIKPADPQTKAKAWVLEPKALVKWIHGAPVRMSQDEVRRIESVLVRYLRSNLA